MPLSRPKPPQAVADRPAFTRAWPKPQHRTKWSDGALGIHLSRGNGPSLQCLERRKPIFPCRTLPTPSSEEAIYFA